MKKPLDAEDMKEAVVWSTVWFLVLVLTFGALFGLAYIGHLMTT